MKELQNFLYKHMDALKHHKRYVAMLTALSLLVSFMVPLILIEPADSMTKQKLMLLSDTSNMTMVSNLNNGQDGNNGYSKGQLSEVTLLIGEHNDSSNPTTDRIDWADGCTNALQVVEAAKREFFIGIASEFCLFLEDNFTPTDSDTEGRVAVGGNVEYKNKENKNSNYQIAAGDFQTGSTSNSTSLIKLKDQYLGLKNFAHLIMGGNTLLDIAPYGTTDKGATIVAEDDDRYKRFVVPETFDVYANFHHEGQWANGDSIEYGKDSHSHAMGGNVSYTTSDEEAQFYGKTGLIDFTSMYDWMRTQSEKLANKTPTGTTSDFVSASVNSSKKKVIFTGPGTNSDDPTVYFTLPSWPSDLVEIEFVGIPEFTNEDGSTTYANMVVNCMDTGIVEIPQNPNRVIINGKRISKEADTEENNQKESELILYNFPLVGTDITNDPLAVNGELPKKHFDAGGDSWDEPYNFYINKNFNGTIFAPNALVVSEKGCEGHLSGALIAKAFTGGLEFGYRPYRGGTDILGSTAGYVVPFDKFVDDLNGNDDNPKLAGATFEIKDEHENIVDTWTSTEETSYITFPTELDFAGGKNYTEDNKTVTHTYTISEKSAPEGYITTDKKYKVKITETVDLGYLLLVDNGTIPTRVTVNLDLYEINGSSKVHKGTRTLYIRDGYDENQHVQRIIEVQNGENKDYFILTIENGNITKIEKVNESSSFESLLQQADAETISFNAVTYSGTDILAEEPITVDPYPYAHTPENLLTDYQVVAFNELRQISHVVGAMTAKTFVSAQNVFGNAAKANSYFENIGTVDFSQEAYSHMQGNLADYALNNYFGSGKFYEEDNGDYYVYYQNKGDFLNIKGNNNDIDKYIVNISNPYINFETAQSDVQTWSNNKKTEANAIKIESLSSDNNIDIIVNNDSDIPNKNVVISEGVFSNLKKNNGKIRFVGINNTDVDIEVLKKKGIVITICGELDNDEGQDNCKFEFQNLVQYKNGDTFSNFHGSFKINNQTDDSQVNLYGTKVIWNFPDVDYNETESDNGTITKGKIKVENETGHIVAPKAYVLIGPGEGGILAENVWVGDEIHYYPYYVNTNRTGDDVPTADRPTNDQSSGGTGNESGGTTGGGTNDDETNDDETPDVIEPQFPPITDYSETVTEITITDKKTPQKLTNSNYYYDPTSLMIMPLPDGTPSFTNGYGLVFKKQDENGNALTGAAIKLQSGTISSIIEQNPNGDFNDVSSPAWSWDDTTSSYVIPLSQIEQNGKVYRFFEETPPTNYETADPIYFTRNGTTIKYTNDKSKLNNTNDWNTLDLTKGEHTIVMTDLKKHGPEIKLSKVQIGSSNPLQGAEFVLYAVDGDTLVYPLNDGTKLTSGSDGMIDFTKVFKANPDNCNSEYIKNGYLVPGEYYLKETKAPDKYEVPTDNMYFIVEENNGNYVIRADKSVEPDYAEFTFDTAHAKEVKAYGTAEAVTSMEIYVTGASTIELWDGPFAYGTDYGGITANVIDGVATFTNVPPTITNFKVQNKDNYDSGLTVTAVKVYSTPIPPTAYTLSSEPQLSAGNAYEVGFNTEDNISGISTQSGNKTKTISVGSANANKTIEKIEFVISYVSGAGVQIKPNGNYDDQLVFSPDSADTSNPYEYVPPKTIKLDSNGNIVITCWNIVIDEIRFYIEGMESTGTCDLTVSTVKAYYIDGPSETATSINALPKKDNIIGLEVTLGGSGSGNIQVNDAWKATGVTAGETVTFGETNYTPPAAETGNSTLISVKDGTTDTLLVGNNQKGEKTNIKVVKVWSDSENLYNTRPNEIKVKLRRDGVDFNIPNTDSPILTLTAEKNWQAELKNLPSLKSGNVDDETAEYYQYSFVELDSNNNEIVPNGTLNGYTVSYGNQVQSGEFTITNTLKTTNIPVEKKWKNSDGSTATPNINQITVKLQKHNGSGYSDFLDKDGNPVTLVLSSNNNWAGEFTGIPEGQYQVVESVVPSGWTETRVTENGKTIITNTQKSGTLKLIKIWQNDTAVQRPQNITIKIYRTTTRPNNGTTGGDNNVDAIPPENSKYETVTEDYARLLQYSLYFYDANMCGDEVTKNSVYSWRNDCHTYDGEYAGGFHDAGDHAMFGLPQGFTASTLGWTYNEYKTTFDSLGLTNHYQLIMKEFCDFFVKSTKMSNGSVSDLLLDKGDADTDHRYWGSPEAQTQGERGGLVWANSSNSGGNIAAEYAAALASYYLNFPNDSNSSTYLEYAKALYDYSNVKNSPRSIGGIYEDNSITDEQAWAAAWIYLATNEETYKNDCKNKLNSLSIPARGHFWGDPTLGAAIIYATRIEPDETTIENKISTYLNSTCSGDSFKVLDSWGSARHNTLLQLTAITYDKYQSTKSYSDWCKKQMAFILGDNSINVNGKTGVCFVTGFKDGDSDESNDAYLPQHPHHRAASGYNGWDKFNDAKANGTSTQYKYAHTLIGALAGGPRGGNSYTDNIDDTVCNEVAIDYNAGLVGAAAALYSVYEKGNTVNADVMKADGLEIKDDKTIYEEQAQAASVNIGDIMNTSAMSFKRNAVSVLDNNTVEMMYPAYTTSATVTNNQEIRVKNVFSYTNLTKIEVDYTINNNYGGGYDMSILTSDDENNGYSNGKEQVDENTVRFTVLSWAKEKTFTGFRVKIWNMDSLTINEIRFYYEGTGPSITITNAPTQALKIGATHQLSATGTENQIKWSSNSDKVIIGENTGELTVNGYPTNGKVTITATDSTDNTVSASVEIEIEALSLTPPSSNVVIGDKVVYNANYDGFTINSGTGYSVNEKEVTATNTGNYTVSATYAGSSATATLNVSALQITNLVTPLGVNATHTFRANGDADGHTFEWISSDPTVLSFDENVLGLATTHKSGNVKIKVIKDGQYASNEYDVAVQKGALSISVNPTQIRVGDTAELSATNNEGNEVEYSCNSDFITISGNTITAGNVEIQETVEITGTLGQESATCNLTIIPLPSISAPDSKNRIGIGETLQLTASNILGTATWRSEDTSILTVDENGLVTGVSTGTTTIIVEDTDGTIGTYEITVAELAADPGLPDEPEFYTTVTLTSADLANGNWEKIVNLPIEDGNGQKYYYYIEEVTVNDVVNGNGGKYMPIKYEGQGVTLNEVGSETPEISVTNRLTQTIQGQLPSTGGSGVKTYYYLGGAIMLLGIAGFTGLRRRERKRREE